MSAALIAVVALATALIAGLVSPRALRAAAAAAGLATCVVVALAAPPLPTIAVGDTVFALATRGAGVVATAAASMLLLLGAAVWRREQSAAPARPMSHALPVALPLTVAAVAAAVAAIDGTLLSAPTAGGGSLEPGTAAAPIAAALVTAASITLAPLSAWQPDPALVASAVRAAGRAVRVAILACGLGLAGMAWLLAPSGLVAPDPAGATAAILLVSASVALFMGALPFHGVAVRVSVTGPMALTAARSVWLPAAFALAAVAWSQRVLAPSVAFTAVGAAQLFADARAIVAVVALLTLAGGALAATFHDDIRHVLAYALVGDAGMALLTFASADPAAGSFAAAWLPVNAVVRTAFVTWAVALTGRSGTGFVHDLHGWARQSPLLGLALAAIAVATFGLPGWGIFALRSSLVDAGGGPMWPLMASAAWLGLLPYLRLLWVGLQRRTVVVEDVAEPVVARRRRPAHRNREESVTVGSPAIRRGMSRLLAASAEHAGLVTAGVTVLAAALAVILAWSSGVAVTAID